MALKQAIRTWVMLAAAVGGMAPLLTSAQQSPYALSRAKALAFEQQGNTSEAIAEWQALSKTYPANPEPFAQLALLNARQQKYKEAIPLYRRALAINPNVSGLRMDLALALFKSEEMKEAIPEFAQVLQDLPADSPDAQRARILLGMSHYGLAQYAEAVPYLKDAAARDSQNLPLRLALAHSCLWSKQFPCVMDVYHEILTLNAESAEADMLAGEALDELTDVTGAIAMFRAAIAANPKEPGAHFGLGYVLWTQKQYPEAAAEFQAELANDPQHAQAMAYLGDTLLQMNQAEAARPLLTRAIALDSSLWLGDLDLGIIDSDAGRNDQAVRELQAAARLQDKEVNVHWRLARLYRAMGKKGEAKAEFDKASKLNKDADEDLYQKVNHGRLHPPDENALQEPAPQQATPQP